MASTSSPGWSLKTTSPGSSRSRFTSTRAGVPSGFTAAEMAGGSGDIVPHANDGRMNCGAAAETARELALKKSYARSSGVLRNGGMKTILAITALAFILFVQSGCTANTGVSVGHDDHAHGVAVKGAPKAAFLAASKPIEAAGTEKAVVPWSAVRISAARRPSFDSSHPPSTMPVSTVSCVPKALLRRCHCVYGEGQCHQKASDGDGL